MNSINCPSTGKLISDTPWHPISISNRNYLNMWECCKRRSWQLMKETNTFSSNAKYYIIKGWRESNLLTWNWGSDSESFLIATMLSSYCSLFVPLTCFSLSVVSMFKESTRMMQTSTTWTLQYKMTINPLLTIKTRQWQKKKEKEIKILNIVSVLV